MLRSFTGEYTDPDRGDRFHLNLTCIGHNAARELSRSSPPRALWSIPLTCNWTRNALALAACLAGLGSLPAAEVVTLTAGNAAAVAPAGKEADWIHGDHVLRNDRIVAVIAKPVATRHANMTVRNVGGCLIDLTSRERQNDQLSCYYPAAGLAAFRTATASADGGGPVAGDDLAVNGGRVRLEAVSAAAAARPAITVAYELADGDDFLTITTTWSNPCESAVPVSVADRVRADRTPAEANASRAARWCSTSRSMVVSTPF
jgi:hypothetical protein